MPGLSKRRPKPFLDDEVDMVPIMNMFLVIVPFLLMSASFIHLKAINTSVPVMGSESVKALAEKTIKVTVIAEIKPDGLFLSLNSDHLDPEDLRLWSRKVETHPSLAYDYTVLGEYLKQVKTEFPQSDTLILIPDNDVVYDTIIKTMDVARCTEDKINLFPNVVISGMIT